MILAIKTDQPDAELYLLDNSKTLAQKKWLAGHNLSRQLLGEIQKLLKSQKLAWADLSGIIIFAGPGSFTGLRISVTIANAMAYSLQTPIVGAQGQNWLKTGSTKLKAQPIGEFALPEYGAPANITLPKK